MRFIDPRGISFRAGILIASLLAIDSGRANAQDQGGRTLLVTVVDTRGKMLVDFGPDDFLVSDAGRERDVVDVHIADYPVVLLLDSGVDLSFWPTIKTATQRFIGRIGERPVMIGV